MDHAATSITAPSKLPAPSGGSGLSQSESSNSQPHDQIHVLVQPLLELPGGGSLGGSESDVLGRLPSDGSESDGCDSDSLSELLSDVLWDALPEGK